MQEIEAVAAGARATDPGSPAGPGESPTGKRGHASVPTLDLSGEWTPPLRWLASVWASRDLIATLARKDFFVKYRRASLGVLWAVGLPVIQAIVLSVVFSQLRVIRAQAGISMPVFVFTGMMVYTYFNATVVAASTSIVDGSGLASKIYFPRAVLPLVNVRANLYSMPILIAIVLIMALAFGVGIDFSVFLLIPGLMLLVWLSAALALTLAALHVYFRDVRYVVQAVFNALIYCTPIFLPLTIYPSKFRGFVLANPVTGVVEIFRLGIGGADDQWPIAVCASVAWAFGLTLTAVYLHCRRDRVFVDLL
jgi:lipopolysaccharide transport system permease protein